MSGRLRTTGAWLLAVAVAALLGYVQRTTGPSYPVAGSVAELGPDVRYRLPRSHGGDGGLEVSVRLPDAVRGGAVSWRRFPTAEQWRQVQLVASDGVWSAEIPHQPPAGKVEYWLTLDSADGAVRVPADRTVVARFRGEVPAGVLIPHILAMFGSLVLTTRALIGVLRPAAPGPRGAVLVGMALLVVGGLVLGPIVQFYAFGALWTGWPLGSDLTDNKTLVAVLAWLPATIAALRRRRGRLAVVVGWLVMMAVFLIPHSLRGSQLDWDAHPPGAAAGATAGSGSAAGTGVGDG